ncbi:MAG TPA: hypothetical protein ENJ43_02295 [Gammaproteobacteria bacterium]|nr:hypothetical protein [Gammaproteobacteria bacterium]
MRSSRSLLYVLVLLVLGAHPMAQAAGGVELQLEPGPDRLRLIFVWDQPVMVLHEVDGRDLLLRFSRQFPATLLSDVEARIAGWIDWSTAGYDSLLIHAGRDVQYQVASDGERRITVVMTPAPRKETEHAARSVESISLARRESAALRLERLRAAVLAEQGRLFAARRKLARLHEQYPDNGELLPEMGSIEARLGQWQQAITYFNRALHTGQGDPGLVAAKAGLLYEYGPQVRLDMDWQQLHGADWQRITRLTGRDNVGQRTTLGFVWENRVIRDNVVRRIAGPLQSFRGQRDYFELYGQHHFDWAAYTRLALSGVNEGIVGFRAEYSQRLDLARVWVDANYHAPAWEYVEGIVDGGRSDTLTLGWERPGSDGWRRPVEEALSTRATLAVRRYGVDGDNDVAESYLLTLGARMLLQEGIPRLSVGYKMELEEITSQDERRFGNVTYYTLPVISQQVHTLDAIWFDRLSDYLRYDFGVGASFDPYNDAGGPFVAANLAWEPLLGLEAGLKFVYSAGPYRGEYARYSKAGGYLLWRF